MRPSYELQREVDSRRHACRGRELPVDDVTLIGHLDAKLSQCVPRQPVGRRPPALEHSRLCEEQGASANRANPFRLAHTPPDVVHQDRVLHQRDLSRTAGDQDEVERRRIGEGGGRSDLHAAVGLYGAGTRPDEVHIGLGNAGQHLPGPDEIQRSNPRID